MRKKLMIFIITGAIALSVSSCGMSQAEDSMKDALNSLQTKDSKEVQSIKNGYLSAYSTDITIGKAFEDFFGLPMWQSFKSDTDEQIIEFNGQCMYNDKTVGATIQFILNDDDTFQLYALAFNDIEQNMLTLNALMEKVYEKDNNETQDDEGWVDESYEDYYDDSDDFGGSYKTLTEEETEEVYGFTKPDLARIAKNSYLDEYSDEFTIGEVLGNLCANDEWEWRCTNVYEHRYEVEYRGNCYYNGNFAEVVIPFNLYPGSSISTVYSITINGEEQDYDAAHDFLRYAYDLYAQNN
ncbi:MAG: hypothetical protein J1F64_04495 [Oscillospiraceae bacterium]|nr:hypothetical protein [Oscillospiraceae bacterium]